MIIDLMAKNPAKNPVIINFEGEIQEMLMTHEDSLYFKDKENFFRLVCFDM